MLLCAHEGGFPKLQTASWNKILTKIESCTQRIVAKENQQQQSYEDYREAANEFSQLTDPVKKELCNSFFAPKKAPKEQFIALKKFSKVVHPFPVSEAIYRREKNFLQKALQAVKELSGNSEAVELKQELETRTLDLEFNYAYFFGIRVLEKMNASKQKAAIHGVEKSIDLATEMAKSIDNYKKVESLYMQQRDVAAANVCRDSIVASMEHLADHYFDAAQVADPVAKVMLFEQAIETYQSMKKYVNHLPEEILHSIFEARYLLAKSHLETGNFKEAKEQLLQLRDEMKLFLKNQDYLTWHFANFYNLESLGMLYQIDPDKSIRHKALVEIKWLLGKQNHWPKELSIQEEISGWIAKAQVLFK